MAGQLDHDGMNVICAGCRSPLQANLVSTTPLDFDGFQLTTLGVDPGVVECANCGASLGPLDELQQDVQNTLMGAELLAGDA